MGIDVRRLLIIDDDIEDCLIMKEALFKVNPDINFLCIQNAQKVISIIRDFKPDIVFTDIHMPEISGLECVQIVKRSFPDLPVVAYSGSEDKEQILSAYHNGAELVYRKPFSFEELVKGLKIILKIDWTAKGKNKQEFYGKLISLSDGVE
jgi:CheY-like chemotaxis protein